MQYIKKSVQSVGWTSVSQHQYRKMHSHSFVQVGGLKAREIKSAISLFTMLLYHPQLRTQKTDRNSKERTAGLLLLSGWMYSMCDIGPGLFRLSPDSHISAMEEPADVYEGQRMMGLVLSTLPRFC